MQHEALGNELKKKARAEGNFVPVNIKNVYHLLETLSVFFYRKHHEWSAICFLKQDFLCNRIWFNKGPNRTIVQRGLQPEEVVTKASKLDTQYIIVAHNHPVSSKDLPDYGSRSANIQASYDLKEQQFGFSAQDNLTFDYYSEYISQVGLGYADAVFVAGDYQIYGDEAIIDNFNSKQRRYEVPKYNASSPKTSSTQSDCFIVTLCFGKESPEYQEMVIFRDEILSKSLFGKAFIRVYYWLSPYVVRVVHKSSILTMITRRLVSLLVSFILYCSKT